MLKQIKDKLKQIKDKLNIHVKNIQKDNSKIQEENIPTEKLKDFHRIIYKCCQELSDSIIIKGSRATNKFLPDKDKIYTEEELFYVDYDLYSYQLDKDIMYIINKLEQAGHNYLRLKTVIFKTDISRLSFYSVPLLDIEQIDKKYYKNIICKKIDNINYVTPEYYKIDLYSILSQPIKINLLAWNKTLQRVNKVETNFTYKKTDIQKYNNQRNIRLFENIISNINTNISIVIGDYSYYKQRYGNIKLNYLELLTKYPNPNFYINKLVNKFNYNKELFEYKKFNGILYMMSYYYIIYYNSKPIIILWNMVNSTQYVKINNVNYCSSYYLKFYYNVLKYYNDLNDVFKYQNYEALLANINITELPNTRCIGEINPGALEYVTHMKKYYNGNFIEYMSNNKELNKESLGESCEES